MPVDISFDPGSSQLTSIERSKLEAAVAKARASAGGGGLNVAFAIYSNEEASGAGQLKLLVEQRVRTLRESFSKLGLDAAAVLAVLGDPSTRRAPSAPGGLAEIEVAFGCGGS